MLEKRTMYTIVCVHLQSLLIHQCNSKRILNQILYQNQDPTIESQTTTQTTKSNHRSKSKVLLKISKPALMLVYLFIQQYAF